MGQIKVWHLLVGVIMVITGVTMMQFEHLFFPPPAQSAGWCIDNGERLTCRNGVAPGMSAWMATDMTIEEIEARLGPRPADETPRAFIDNHGRRCTVVDAVDGMLCEICDGQKKRRFEVFCYAR